MPFFTTTRAAVLLLLFETIGAVCAQSSGSPYSAYGFGDLLPAGQTPQALKGGTGLALSEPFSLSFGNPANYAALARPVFDVGFNASTVKSTTDISTASRGSADLTGFSVGVPFGGGKWGIGLGLTPYSNVDYSTSTTVPTADGDVRFNYSGSGGLDRAFFGVGRSLLPQQYDSLGNAGMTLRIGAEFNFLFGNVEQTRDAIYPAFNGFNNTRAFSSLVLRAPTANASVMWQGDLTRKVSRDADNWRWGIGISVDLPTAIQAHYNRLAYSFVSINNIEAFRDSISSTDRLDGTIDLPLGLGLGIGVQNARWAIAAEYRLRDWAATSVNVPEFALPSALSASSTIALGATFTPQDEGSLFRRAMYRFGLRQTQGPIEVRGHVLTTSAVTAGLSLPINAIQTNSWLHLGVEAGTRGTTTDGLVKEQYTTLWLGITFTPWRGERWFTKPRIQ
jgi:hypothetical protein